MVSTVIKIDMKKLPKAKFSAVKREARRLGLSPDEYILRVVENLTDLQEEARTTSWQALTEPFRKALHGIGDEELDALIERARRAPVKRKRAPR